MSFSRRSQHSDCTCDKSAHCSSAWDAVMLQCTLQHTPPTATAESCTSLLCTAHITLVTLILYQALSPGSTKPARPIGSTWILPGVRCIVPSVTTFTPERPPMPTKNTGRSKLCSLAIMSLNQASAADSRKDAIAGSSRDTCSHHSHMLAFCNRFKKSADACAQALSHLLNCPDAPQQLVKRATWSLIHAVAETRTALLSAQQGIKRHEAGGGRRGM